MKTFSEHKRRDVLAKVARARKAYFAALRDATTYGGQTGDASLFHDIEADTNKLPTDMADLSAHMNRVCVKATGRPL